MWANLNQTRRKDKTGGKWQQKVNAILIKEER